MIVSSARTLPSDVCVSPVFAFSAAVLLFSAVIWVFSLLSCRITSACPVAAFAFSGLVTEPIVKRIAVLAPVAMPIRPGEGDSIEQLVSLLTEELVRRGHDVTLFAVGDSETTAELRSVYAHGYRENVEIWDWRVPETLNAASAFEQASAFDVMHSHSYHFALPFTRFVSTPVVHTYHVQLGPEVLEGFRRYPEAQLVAISDFQRRELDGFDSVPVIHNGIDVEAFPFSADGGQYLAFLGRMIPSKGPA